MEDNTKNVSISENKLLNELSQLIVQSKQQVSIQANSAITILFWQVGNHINQDILENKRAEYGKQIVPTLSAQLKNKYGRNFEEKNLRRMMQFADQFADTNCRYTVTTIELVSFFSNITHREPRSQVILCTTGKQSFNECERFAKTNCKQNF